MLSVILLFPFVGFLVKMTYLVVPGDDKKVGYRDSFQLKYIGDKVVFNPATAVVEVIKEIERMADLASENLNRAMNALITLDEEDIQEVYAVEKNINFLGDERFALWCIILILFTTSVGQPIVLYVSALGNVDTTLIEAAQVDGANDIQVFWKVKWPQMMPTTLYILVITTINSFQCFALIQLLTQGGSGTNTVLYYIYFTAFKLTEQRGHFGYANAMGVVLAIFIGILSAVQFKLAKEK